MTTVAQETTLTRRRRRWESLPYWLILPTVVYLGLFFVWPMIQGFGLALRDESGNWTTTALETMVDDAAFGEAMSFTFLLILVILPIQFVLAFGMALLLNARLRGGGLFLYIFLLPLAISDLAAGIAWSAIFTERGYLNTILEGVGVIDQPFIFLDPTSKTQLVIAVAAAEIWRSTTFMMVILFAGLQAIPRDYVEAAEVFGAGFFQRVRHVILPMLKPSIQVAILLRLIFAFEVFAVVIALTGLRGDGARGRGLQVASDQRERARGGRILDGHSRPLPRRRGGRADRASHPAGAEASLMALQRIRIGRAFAYLAAIAISVFVLAPIYLITISAFSSFDAVYEYPKNLVPSDLSMESMNIFLDSDGVTDSLQRSVYVAIITIIACLAIGTPAGYALARFSFRAANPFQLALVSTRAFPLIIIAIPLAVTYLRFGIDDTVYGVAMAHIAFTLPLTVLVMASVFAGISYELEEAAMTLGCSRLSAFRRVALPQALPGVAASAIFIFVTTWNEVFAAALLTLRNRTLPAQMLAALDTSPLPYRLAGGFFLLAPALVVIFFIRKYLLTTWGRVAR